MLFGIIVVIPIVLLVLALLLEPLAQSRREHAIWERMKSARDANEAKAVIDGALETNKDKTKLPDNWNDSYRYWQK
jgi:hypothetical protein